MEAVSRFFGHLFENRNIDICAVEVARNAAVILVHRDDDAPLVSRLRREDAKDVVSLQRGPEEGVVGVEEPLTQGGVNERLASVLSVCFVGRANPATEALFGGTGESEANLVRAKLLDECLDAVDHRVLGLAEVGIVDEKVFVPLDNSLDSEADLIDKHVAVDEKNRLSFLGHGGVEWVRRD